MDRQNGVSHDNKLSNVYCIAPDSAYAICRKLPAEADVESLKDSKVSPKSLALVTIDILYSRVVQEKQELGDHSRCYLTAQTPFLVALSVLSSQHCS